MLRDKITGVEAGSRSGLSIATAQIIFSIIKMKQKKTHEWRRGLDLFLQLQSFSASTPQIAPSRRFSCTLLYHLSLCNMGTQMLEHRCGYMDVGTWMGPDYRVSLLHGYIDVHGYLGTIDGSRLHPVGASPVH